MDLYMDLIYISHIYINRRQIYKCEYVVMMGVA